MLSNEQVLKLMADNEIVIEPFTDSNLSEGSLLLTLAAVGSVAYPPVGDDYKFDSKEIVLKLSVDDLPMKEIADIEAYALGWQRSIEVKSRERIKLPDHVTAVVYPTAGLSVDLNVQTSNMLKPGHNDYVTFSIMNSWEYPVYLKPGAVIARVVFFSRDHSYLSGLDHLDHPASAIMFSGYSGLVSDNVQDAIEELQTEINGFSGAMSGYSGYSGQKGTDGTIGHDGLSGYSGYSGIGTSGYSGYSGAAFVGGAGGVIPFSRNGIVKINRSLEINGIPSNILGWPMGRNGKIKSIFVNCLSATTGCMLQIIGTDSGVLWTSPTPVTAGRNDFVGLDVDFTDSDDLSCRVSVGSIMKPVVLVDFIWS